MKSARYDSLSRNNASKALFHIENDKGKLSRALKVTTKEYAIEVLGSKKYAPWLNVYTALSGEFKEGWIPDNYYRKIVVPEIQGEYGQLSFLKTLNNTLFNVPIGPDIAYFINGKWFSQTLAIINRQDLKAMLFSAQAK